MSRCFPYPPPGYVCNRAAGVASLIESIKIEKENERIKQEKKEQKRREKDLKKKEKKEKKKEKERLKSSIQNSDGANKRKRDCDESDKSVKKNSLLSSKEVYLQKTSEAETEQLERSSLTEEYGLPIVSDGLCYSSDGTQSETKKCKVEESPSNGSCNTQGKVIRFRLKRREENVSPTDDVPSTSDRIDNAVTEVNTSLHVKDAEYVIPRPNEHLAISAPLVHGTSNSLASRSKSNKVSRPKSAYECLFSELALPNLYDAV